MFSGQHVMKKRSVLMGVIIDKIIFHSNIELSCFPYSFVVSPKMSIINMISVLMSSYEDM